MRLFRDPRIPGVVLRWDGRNFEILRNNRLEDTVDGEDLDSEKTPEENAKHLFDQIIHTDLELNSMTQTISQGFGDMGVGVNVENEPLTRPSQEQISRRIDQLLAEIDREVNPVKKEALKKEALRLIAQEESAQHIVRELLR